MKHEEEQDLFQGFMYDETMSDTGSIEKEDQNLVPKPHSSSPLSIYHLLFDDTTNPTNIILGVIVLLIISGVQFVPFYMELHEMLPYIQCGGNFCIANNPEDLESKIQTLCRGGDSLLGETHYFSMLHRILLGYTAIMTNFLAFFGVLVLVVHWNKLFAELHYFKVVAYFAAQMTLFFLSTAVIKVVDWNNMKPDSEYSLIPIDATGCINISVIYTYYRPDDIHDQFWILAAIYFPLFIIAIFRFLWNSIKLRSSKEWSFRLGVTILGASTLAGWIFALVINYAAGIQFSVLNDSNRLVRIQQIVNFAVTGVVFLSSMICFCWKRCKSVDD